MMNQKQKKMKPKLAINKNLTIDDMPILREQIKQKIEDQKDQVISSAQHLVSFSSVTKSSFTPLSLVTTPFTKGKIMNLVQGAIVGYKIVRSIRRFIRK